MHEKERSNPFPRCPALAETCFEVVKHMKSVEKWDVLDSDGKPTGRKVLRGRAYFRPGEYHLVVHIWILSREGNYLIQKRAAAKKLMPGEWAATGGAAIAGETSYQAANRELQEELGIYSTPQTLRKLIRLHRRTSLLDLWAIMVDIPAERLVLQQSEVAEAKWISPEELHRMIGNGEFHDYGETYFDSLFREIEKYRGAIL